MLNVNEKFLVGEKLLKIEVDKDRQHLLRLTTDKDVYIFFTVGDCCSETWFADINGPSLVLNKTITKVKQLGVDDYEREEISKEMSSYNVDDGRTRQEKDQAYALVIDTDGGTLDIIYRNSSNGYYGGEICLLNNEVENEDFRDHYDLDYNPSDVKWEEVKDDWQATGNG